VQVAVGRSPLGTLEEIGPGGEGGMRLVDLVAEDRQVRRQAIAAARSSEETGLPEARRPHRRCRGVKPQALQRERGHDPGDRFVPPQPPQRLAGNERRHARAEQVDAHNRTAETPHRSHHRTQTALRGSGGGLKLAQHHTALALLAGEQRARRARIGRPP